MLLNRWRFIFNINNLPDRFLHGPEFSINLTRHFLWAGQFSSIRNFGDKKQHPSESDHLHGILPLIFPGQSPDDRGQRQQQQRWPNLSLELNWKICKYLLGSLKYFIFNCLTFTARQEAMNVQIGNFLSFFMRKRHRLRNASNWEFIESREGYNYCVNGLKREL